MLTEGETAIKKRPCYKEGKIMPCDFKSAKVCIAEYEEFFDSLVEKLQKQIQEAKKEFAQITKEIPDKDIEDMEEWEIEKVEQGEYLCGYIKAKEELLEALKP